MRKPEYLSPSSFNMWLNERDDFYKKYCSPNPPPRMAQTIAMSIGSAFDAFAKSFLHEKLIGKNPKFEFRTIFEAQVESHNRDQALKDGKYIWDCYNESGGLALLMEEMNGCIGPPNFETDISGIVVGKSANIMGVPLLGKPDIFFTANTGARITHDWKVNGMYDWKGNYHKTGQSPKKYYVKSLPDFEQHPEFDPTMHKGILIHKGCGLEGVDETWANQLCIYSWLLGETVGADFICAIDQLVCRTSKVYGRPNVRTIKHRCLVTPRYQVWLFEKLQECWAGLSNDHVFTELTLSDSQARCKMLDAGPAPADDDFSSLTRER